MKFTQLHLAGFKSFVSPADLQIDPGLTGIIGPNGCGKSNLLEALRWVMGATSAKSLRGGGMDDVIFSGTDQRASRERAEVRLKIDNSDHSAPARFNDHQTLEIIRRITRGKGSDYKINGEEVRAKDVQLLFADAGTGANSPALVRQGQISELISAKPENRRRILEEAAGVGGLRARRREAQLRLNAAEANLARLSEILDSLDSRHAALQRQAKQASRYRDLSQSIRSLQSLLWLRRWTEAVEILTQAETELAETDKQAEQAIIAAAMATRESEQAHARVQPLRDTEAEASAALRLAERTRDQLDRDLKAVLDQIEQFTHQLTELDQNSHREQSLKDEAETALKRHTHDLESLKTQATQEDERLQTAQNELQHSETQKAYAEKDLDQAATICADIKAQKTSTIRDVEAARQRFKMAEQETQTAKTALGAFQVEDQVDLESMESEATAIEDEAQAARKQADLCEEAYNHARNEANMAREQALSVQSDVQALSREKINLEHLLSTGQSENQILDQVTAQPGYELALAAAMGEDLEASLSQDADRFWQISDAKADTLPSSVKPLLDFVSAPIVLHIRLSAIGIVDADHLQASKTLLKPGQRLVTLDGALYRWDGYEARAGAPTQMAVRLETRNCLNEVEAQLETANRKASDKQHTAQELCDQVNEAEIRLKELRTHVRSCETRLRQHEQNLATAKARSAQTQAQKTALSEALGRAENRLKSAQEDLNTCEIKAEDCLKRDDGQDNLDLARQNAETQRNHVAEARAKLDGIKRDAQARRHRQAALEREHQDWSRRFASANDRLNELIHRKQIITEKLEIAKAKPDKFNALQPELIEALDQAHKRANEARERVAEAELGHREHDTTLRAAEKFAAEAREARAASHARMTAARERIEETTQRLSDATGQSPQSLQERCKNSELQALSSHELDCRLDEARLSRDRLGAVNLRADQESQELEAEREGLKKECNDLSEAVDRLKKAIDTLSREGRARLLDAFETVDRHFQTLFSTLFDGGHAKLELTESEDPLEAGLEIYACPPGKKMETMSLMSGGEQALTATALIFAVFLVNPAPVCVLDEVDAPLDDVNVDRFCAMLSQMRSMTETRFLIITHNPVTMSRMDRLFGVTMGERGVSQLVSVNLRAAEEMLAAE